MRVSSVGWLYDTMEQTRYMARISAEATHNHPEGIKGAEATANAIYLARHGASGNENRDYIASEFGYDLSSTCDAIRLVYRHAETCQETVPEAFYGVSKQLIEECRKRLPQDMLEVPDRFDAGRGKGRTAGEESDGCGAD